MAIALGNVFGQVTTVNNGNGQVIQNIQIIQQVQEAPQPQQPIEPNHHENKLKPCSNESFVEIKSMIMDEKFASDKLEIAKQATKGEHLTAEQIRDIAKLLQYESDRVEYLTFAYEFCFDKNKYYLVNQAFQYSSSKDELKEALGL